MHWSEQIELNNQSHKENEEANGQRRIHQEKKKKRKRVREAG